MPRARRELSRVLAALGMLALGRACFVEIAEPRNEAVDGDTDSGSGGVSGVGTGGAGAGGGTGPTGGTTGTGAVGGSTGGIDGAGGAAGGNSTGGGSGGIPGCGAGSFDCDGLPGCETRFGPAPSQLPLSDGGSRWLIPSLASPPSIDGQIRATEWPDDVPLVPIANVCVSCTSGLQPGGRVGPEIVFFQEKPDVADLSAYFRVAWNSSALYVGTLVLDDEIYAPVSDSGMTRADQHDGIELFISGTDSGIDPSQQGIGLGPTAHHLFVGLNGEIFVPSPSDTPPSAGEVLTAGSRSGRCYFIETRLAWTYLRKFLQSPTQGALMRFDIAVNDWDTVSSPQREHQIVWQDPGASYADLIDGYPVVILD